LNTFPADQAIEKVNILKDQGIIVAVVGVGSGLNNTLKSESLNIGSVYQNMKGEAFLKQYIVSDPSLYIDVNDWSQLEQVVHDTFTQDFFTSTRAGFVRQEL